MGSESATVPLRAVVAACPDHGSAVVEARDPICGMRVEMATARYRSEVSGQVAYFCCLHCKETFDTDPRKHAPAR